MRSRRHQGFTLIELMIAVAVVGIIIAIGYPSYKGVVVDGYRGTAQADLLALASAMERHNSGTFSYKGAASGGSDTGEPAIFATYSPSSEPAVNKRYNLEISAATAGAYEIRAVPVSGSSQAGDGTLFYFSDGRKAWDKNNSGGAPGSDEYCWSC